MKKKRLVIVAAVIVIVLIVEYRSNPNPAIKSMAAGISEQNLRTHITQLTAFSSQLSRPENGGLSGIPHTTPQAKKLTYMTRCLEEYGYRVEQFVFSSPFPNSKGINLIACKAGKVEPNRVLELGAHYDTVGNAGADDNCSGVAGLLEAARILADIPTERSIRFCLYDLEEIGLVGSQEHAQRVKDGNFGKDEVFDGAIVLESIGYAVTTRNSQETPIRIPLFFDPPKTGDFILVVGNFQSGALGRDFERAIKAYATGLDYFSLNRIGSLFQDAARSDHSSYWNLDLPAIMITDTADLRNPNYHQTSDTIETLNFVFLSQVAQATVGALLEYARPVINESESPLR